MNLATGAAEPKLQLFLRSYDVDCSAVFDRPGTYLIIMHDPPAFRGREEMYAYGIVK